MHPDLRAEYGTPPPVKHSLEEATADLLRVAYGTVIGADNLAPGSYEPRSPEDAYAQLTTALHPLVEPEDIEDPLLKQLGREGIVEIISNEQLGLMSNFTTEYVPAIAATLENTEAVTAMKEGRPVLFLPDHDNWVSNALLAIGVAVALRNMGEEELAQRAALSLGYAAASFDNLAISDGMTVDQMEAINVFVDILKSLPNSGIRDSINFEGAEEAIVELNSGVKDATAAVLKSGAALVGSISGTHDTELTDERLTIMHEGGPGTAGMLFGEDTMALNPVFIPCISLCNPYATGRRVAALGTFETAGVFEFSSDKLTPRERSAEVLQTIKALKTRRTVSIEHHPGWGSEGTLPDFEAVTPFKAGATKIGSLLLNKLFS